MCASYRLIHVPGSVPPHVRRVPGIPGHDHVPGDPTRGEPQPDRQAETPIETGTQRQGRYITCNKEMLIFLYRNSGRRLY